MLLKTIIIILFIAMIISLSSGLGFLLKDVGTPSKRTLYALGIRVSIALMLLISLFYGFYTGQLKSQAPWEQVPAYQQE